MDHLECLMDCRLSWGNLLDWDQELWREMGVGGWGPVNRTQGGGETVGGGGRPVFGLHMLKVNVSMEYEEGRSRDAGAWKG